MPPSELLRLAVKTATALLRTPSVPVICNYSIPLALCHNVSEGTHLVPAMIERVPLTG
jgi:hypothetical protein